MPSGTLLVSLYKDTGTLSVLALAYAYPGGVPPPPGLQSGLHDRVPEYYIIHP